MKTSVFRPLLLSAIALVTGACAGGAVKHQAEPIAAEAQPASPVDTLPLGAPSEPAFPELFSGEAKNADGVSAEADDNFGSEDPMLAELDAEILDAETLVRDPWEGFNRKMHRFNNVADRFVLRPIAVGYKKITPAPVRKGVSRFFANLGTPSSAINQMLQGRPRKAGRSLGRFVVNTTIGVAGVFDPASRFGLPEQDEEDFGQTLATWGWRDSRYVVLPLLGPGTIRDTIAVVGDQQLSPMEYVDDTRVTNTFFVLGIANMRAEMLSFDDMRRDAFDDYLFVRDAWVQRRNHEIRQDLQENRD